MEKCAWFGGVLSHRLAGTVDDALSLVLEKDLLSWKSKEVPMSAVRLQAHSAVQALGREETSWEERCCIKSRQYPGIRRTPGALGRLSQRSTPKHRRSFLPQQLSVGSLTGALASSGLSSTQGLWLLFDTPALFAAGGILADRTCSA